MKAHTNDVQIIEQGGQPAFAVIPYEQYLQLVDDSSYDIDVYLPHDVVKRVMLEELSLVKAWRLHLDLSQQDLANRMGVTQGTISQIEKVGSKPQRRTLEKASKAMGINVDQLTDD